MMDPKLVELKNEIAKKNLYKRKKKHDLPEFIRVKKLELLKDREETDRKER